MTNEKIQIQIKIINFLMLNNVIFSVFAKSARVLRIQGLGF